MTARWSSLGVRRDILLAAFCDWFGIENGLASLLVALYERPGQMTTWQHLAAAVDSHRPPTRQALWQRICDLRKAMECEAIDGAEGEGYCLTEVGVQDCNDALANIAAKLAMLGSGNP